MTIFITSTEAYMVAERAVAQAADDLRAEVGLKLQEMSEALAGVKGELEGEIHTQSQVGGSVSVIPIG